MRFYIAARESINCTADLGVRLGFRTSQRTASAMSRSSSMAMPRIFASSRTILRNWGYQMAAVAGGIDRHIGRAGLHPALQNRLEEGIALVVLVKGQIIDK